MCIRQSHPLRAGSKNWIEQPPLAEDNITTTYFSWSKLLTQDVTGSTHRGPGRQTFMGWLEPRATPVMMPLLDNPLNGMGLYDHAVEVLAAAFKDTGTT